MHGRRMLAPLAILLLAPAALKAQGTGEPSPRRPVSTYSIVARDPATGDMGVAVQSHWFSVGAVVPWAEAGVGAVATQSFVEASYGPLGLDLMRMGRSAPEALSALVSTDPNEAVRQVAMVDAQGRVAAHTGSKVIFAAGHHVGDGFSTQANLMENPTVWDAMARAFETTEGDLAERLLAALEAAEGEGGDIRGRQSAAIIVVSGTSTGGKSWQDRKFDLRVEDDPAPVPSSGGWSGCSEPTTRSTRATAWSRKGTSRAPWSGTPGRWSSSPTMRPTAKHLSGSESPWRPSDERTTRCPTGFEAGRAGGAAPGGGAVAVGGSSGQAASGHGGEG